MDDVIECQGGKKCNIVKSELGWGCCMNKARNRCPANFPIMCANKTCGNERSQYCCEATEDECNKLYGGGRRKCDTNGRFAVTK